MLSLVWMWNNIIRLSESVEFSLWCFVVIYMQCMYDGDFQSEALCVSHRSTMLPISRSWQNVDERIAIVDENICYSLFICVGYDNQLFKQFWYPRIQGA